MRILFCGASLLAACSTSEPPVQATPWEEQVSSPELEAGRQVWVANCKRCHGAGMAGAPRIGDVEAWRPRIEKGETMLFQHALGGFEGATGGEMPARGGNAELSDDEVRQAVRFMVSKAQ
jgi:cytochrome c5